MDSTVKQSVRVLTTMLAAPRLNIPTAHLGVLQQGRRPLSKMQIKVKRLNRQQDNQGRHAKETGQPKAKVTEMTTSHQKRSGDDNLGT